MSKAETPNERYKRSTGGLVRTLAGKQELAVTFAEGPQSLPTAQRVGSNSPDNTVRLPAPNKLDAATLAITRGAADAVGLRIKYHNAALHQALQPNEAAASAAFTGLEEARIEALGASAMRGVGQNLAAQLDEQIRSSGFGRSTQQQPEQLASVLKAWLLQEAGHATLGPDATQLLSHWHTTLKEKASPLLPKLQQSLGNQREFAKAAEDVLIALETMSRAPQQAQPEDAPDTEQDGEQTDDSQQSEPQGGGEPEQKQQEASADPNGDQQAQQESAEQQNAELSDTEAQDAARPPQRRPEPKNSGDNSAYKAFTTKYDQIVMAEDLADTAELDRLRQYLDRSVAQHQQTVARLANKLQRKLLAQQKRSWQFDLEEGLLDTGRLARIIGNPLTPLSFKQEKPANFRDTVVTLLIDNSGSMRGRPIATAAICADILARTLERCAVKTEVLGFTTKAWKGGQARENWVQAGKPAAPGRLNDLRHVIYKPADAPYRRARRNLGLMQKEGLLKENIDGEALLWASQRLLARPEERRILLVISDGAPVDDSTLSTNKGDYLDRHLRQVIGQIEGANQIELIAIGIGHDVTKFYRRAVTIQDAEQLAGAMIDKLAELFTDENQHSPNRQKQRSAQAPRTGQGRSY